MSTTTPPFIKKGALFGLVSPAGRIDSDVISRAGVFLERHGFRSRRGKYVTHEHYQFSGTDEERIDDLQAMIDDPEVEVIWCCRGGYGTLRIIDALDFSRMPVQPKWLVGFSDISVIHATLQNNYNTVSVHGPMPVNLPADNNYGAEWNHLLDILQGHDIVYRTPANILNKQGTSAGQLIGGNLSLLAAMTGTRYDFDPRGKILFIEEVGEQLYHLDRMMYQLRLSGKLEHLKGLIVGHLTDMKDGKIPFGNSAREIIRDITERYDYPVLFDFPAGHETPNEPLLMGAQVHLQVSDEGGLVVYYI
ncbi:MAG: muramoyltetrapeptide carboxypeptidase [Anaerophaga sp.]|nr:muramoyltetrapeptide carboxypeptidase [Anaerophaga sp.]MDK2840770.1 muramoyltetrapeptide carboxypeptidase [Anaerophaga sp.]